MQMGREAVTYGKLIAFAGGLDLAPKAVLYDDAVLFAGDVHLSPEAQVKGNVILTAGNATLDSLSTITGRLYLDPDAKPGSGRLFSSSEAQVTRGVVRPKNIEAIASAQIAKLFLGYAVLLFAIPVVIVCLLMGLMFYLGRHSKEPKAKVEAKTASPQPNPQPSSPGMK
jgi:hypothetical protein